MELNQAVKRVADKEGKTVSSVYQELWRHDDRLAEEAIQEGRAIEHAAGLHFVEKYPSLAEKVRLIVAECFGNIALACEALGNADSAAQVRALAPELGEELTTRFAGLLLTSLPLAPK
jgi:ActR/RegA family two-component response regulator